MKTHPLIHSVPKAVLISGIMVFSSSCLSAWTIKVLNPGVILGEPGNVLPNGTDAQTLKNYLEQTGSFLTYGSLTDYAIGDSDAVMIQLPDASYSYNWAELNMIAQLLSSNTRTLIFGEHNGWSTNNSQLAALLGGTDGSGGSTQGIVSDLFPVITDGVSEVYFANPGSMSTNGIGISITIDDTISMWGANNNFLLFMDINVLTDNVAVNDQLAQNVANWLSGIDLAPVPESSSYATVFGLLALAAIPLRRQRKR